MSITIEERSLSKNFCIPQFFCAKNHADPEIFYRKIHCNPQILMFFSENIHFFLQHKECVVLIYYSFDLLLIQC